MVYTAPSWNLAAIISEFRSITGIPDTSMYSNQQCADLINYYYQFVLPKELRSSGDTRTTSSFARRT